jgi:uncharacterized surface protein with fasciclin (FAS1) repeats
MAACGSDEDVADSSASASETSPETGSEEPLTEESSEPAAEAAAAAGAETFGEGCSAIPADGAGSFNGMATEPVASAASANPLLKTLVAAVTEAGLVDTLNSAEGITVFAPTDDAFAKLSPATLNDLLKEENKAKLRRILTYHVVPGRVSSSDVVRLRTAKAVSGDMITIKANGGTVMVDGARVVKTDVQASNGVIHVIDAVILPDGFRQ